VSRAQPARLGLLAVTSGEPPHCHNIVKADTTPPTTVALTRLDLDSRWHTVIRCSRMFIESAR
jgi:hypothetical protein